MHYVLFGIGSRFAPEVDEIIARRRDSVAAYVNNMPGGWFPPDFTPVVEPPEIRAEWLDLPVVIPLITPGHRKTVREQAAALGFRIFDSLVDPTAVMARSVSLADGCIVNTGVVVGAHCRFGTGALLNRSTSIGHDVETGPYATLGPAAVISGSCHIGAGAFIGAGAVVAPKVTIGANSVVGAGTVVIRDVPGHTVVAGNPARIIREHVAGYNDTSV